MLNSRKELVLQARKMYVSLLERSAKRYVNDEKYVVSDNVGFGCTRMEELFRPLWGIAPILNEGDLYITVDGESVRVEDFVTRVLCEGTDPDSERRFDKNVDEMEKERFANQAITEIAAYLVAVYFARERFWDGIPEKKRATIAAWIKKWAIYAIAHSWPNNHYWYPIYCIEILKQLGYDMSDVDADMKYGYDFLEGLYYGDGWYSDGELGRFDYYEAWAHHAYTLLWILIADKTATDYETRAQRYRKRSEEFLNFFLNYFDSNGAPVMYGRSNSYRFAAVCPYGLAALAGCNIDLGQAKSVILKNIGYYFDNCTMVDGCFPCGYLYESTGFIESYTCDGSTTCYTEGFLTLLAGEDHPLWQAQMRPLPIESGDYTVNSPLRGLDILIDGCNEKSGVTIFNNSLHYFQAGAYSFGDMAALYSKFAYNSRAGFTLSSIDNVSVDNMISLVTPRATMASHRRRIDNIENDGGVMISTHTPFENDPNTVIKTWLIPLKEGYHVRVHKVSLAGSYSVREGGFAVGYDTDMFESDTKKHIFRFGNTVSFIDTVSSVEVKFGFKQAHPGMHLLMPQSYVPIYNTACLEAGEYLFATTVGFTTDGSLAPSPTVTLDGTTVTVTQGNVTKTIIVK